ARQPAQPAHVRAGLGDLQRRRGLLALRAVPQQAGAADGLEHLALRQRAGRRARRAGAPQPEPDRAREALRRGAGHHRERDGVDPDLHDEGDHRHARDREGLPDPPRRVQPGALEDLARPLRWGAPTWPPIPPNVRSAPGNPWRSSIPPAFGAPRATRGAPLSPPAFGAPRATRGAPLSPPAFGAPRATRGAPLSPQRSA